MTAQAFCIDCGGRLEASLCINPKCGEPSRYFLPARKSAVEARLESELAELRAENEEEFLS